MSQNEKGMTTEKPGDFYHQDCIYVLKHKIRSNTHLLSVRNPQINVSRHSVVVGRAWISESESTMRFLKELKP